MFPVPWKQAHYNMLEKKGRRLHFSKVTGESNQNNYRWPRKF